MSEQILVPIKIEALVVDAITAKDAGYNWKNFSIDYEGLGTRLGTFMEPVDLKDLSQGGFCEKGIHLHWALPAALTNGIQKDNKMLFPAVPNRWLVIRTHLVNSKPVIKRWLVESDYISPLQSDKSTWAIQQADGSYSTSHNIGKVTDLDKWTVEQNRSEVPLTAVGPGNATFSAIYQYCRNVFGFWDDLSGLTTTATVFSYLVTGWYSDPAIEPLLHADPLIIANLKKKWVMDGAKDPAVFPSEIFCHGFIHSVAWNPAQEYKLPIRSAQVNTGVGLTSVEAKTVQMSRQTGAAEKLLSGYVYDVLKDMVDATAMENVVGSQTFTAYDGGALWEIKRIERDANTEKDKKADLSSFPDADKNPGLSNAFKKINDEQQLADKLQQNKKSLMVEFRALCDKIIMAQMDEDKVLETKLTNSRNLLKNDIDVITATIAQHDAEVLKQQKTINGMVAFMATTNKPAEFELVRKKMPRFWQPTDPTVLFSGPGVIKSLKYKNPDNEEKLICRTVEAIITGLLLNDGDTVAGRTILPGDIPLALKPIGSLQKNIAVITKLYGEAILLDPNWSPLWGLQYYKDSPGSTINAQKLGEYLKKVLLLTAGAPTEKVKALISQDDTNIPNTGWGIDAVTQLLTKRGIQLWAHPWTPLYMIWYVKFVPSYINENGKWNFKAGDWEWKDKQYQYKGTKPDKNKAIEYSGKVLVSDLVTELLQKRLPDNMDAGQHISQALDSFSDALLMRRQSIRVPLLRKQDEHNVALIPDNSFDGYMTKDAYFFPDVNAKSGGAANFFPVRAGHVQFTRLWVTDTFGQVKKIIDSDNKGNIIQNGMLHIAENLITAGDGKLVTLSPRLVQPARLSFRWSAANAIQQEDSSSDPATTPVCGWILPDYLDQALDIYEESGKKCGSLKMITIDGRVQLEWNGPPGAPISTNPQERITNPYLLDFVNGLLNFRNNDNTPGSGAALSQLFDLCNTTALFLTASSAKQSPGIAGLMGQPVALVRATLKMELLGLPAQPQGNEHIITEETKINPPGLSNLSFPVSLGDSRNNKDGLIGYFMDKGSKGFSAMHIAFGMDKPNSDYFTSGDISLTINTNAAPQGITLLVDPRGGVQADAAILPPKFIDLSYPYIDKGLKHMELDILVAPFLGSPADLFIPVGAEPDRQWVLKQKTKEGSWTQTNMDNQMPLQTGSLNTQVVQEGYLSLLPIAPDNI